MFHLHTISTQGYNVLVRAVFLPIHITLNPTFTRQGVRRKYRLDSFYCFREFDLQGAERHILHISQVKNVFTPHKTEVLTYNKDRLVMDFK